MCHSVMPSAPSRYGSNTTGSKWVASRSRRPARQSLWRNRGGSFLVAKGPWPQPVGQRVLQGGRAEPHSRHLTCSHLASSVRGNRSTSASTRLLGGAPENGGRRLNTTT